MSGILYAVGVGPGDPELLTLKAARILTGADIIAAPKKRNELGVAFQIAEKAVPEIRTKKILPLDFPMTKDQELLSQMVMGNSMSKSLGFTQMSRTWPITMSFRHSQTLLKKES